MTQLNTFASNTEGNDVALPDTRLHKYLQPILGTACTIAYIQRLEELNPELKDNDDLVDKFIGVIDKIPDEDKNPILASALKISKIKDDLPQDGDMSKYADAYKDFKNITTRLIPNLYNLAKCADGVVYDSSLSCEEIFEVLESPLASVRTIMLNDSIEKNTSSLQQAHEEMDCILGASGKKSLKYFPYIVQYVAEKSAQTAEIVFNKTDFRKFPEWEKSIAIQDAKKQALNCKQAIDMSLIIKKGRQND